MSNKKPLVVEFNKSMLKDNSIFEAGNSVVAITPDINENYWLFRVHLHKNQYVQAFPKFFTLGIGFAIEDDDWNTNLPYSSDAETIYGHIECNKKYKQITKERVVEAISLLSATCKDYYDQLKKQKSIVNN